MSGVVRISSLLHLRLSSWLANKLTVLLGLLANDLAVINGDKAISFCSLAWIAISWNIYVSVWFLCVKSSAELKQLHVKRKPKLADGGSNLFFSIFFLER